MPLSIIKPILRSSCLQCHRLLTNSQIKNGRRFCSRYCKNESQKKIIILACNGCHKAFSLLPYLKRQTNYCSLECYRRSTKKKVERVCIICHGKFQVKAYLVKQGFGVFCSRRCQNAIHRKQRISIICKQCGKPREVSPAIAKNNPSFCSKKCSDDFMRDYVTRICRNCHRSFQIPTWETKKGKGSFCSRLCFIQYRGESTIEKRVRYALQRSKIKFSQEVKIGAYRADFLLPELNLIIECDGEYWHDRKPGVTARDHRKTVFLQHKGYKVVRFPEQAIRKTPIVRLQSFLQQLALERHIALQPQMPL